MSFKVIQQWRCLGDGGVQANVVVFRRQECEAEPKALGTPWLEHQEAREDRAAPQGLSPSTQKPSPRPSLAVLRVAVLVKSEV